MSTTKTFEGGHYIISFVETTGIEVVYVSNEKKLLRSTKEPAQVMEISPVDKPEKAGLFRITETVDNTRVMVNKTTDNSPKHELSLKSSRNPQIFEGMKLEDEWYIERVGPNGIFSRIYHETNSNETLFLSAGAENKIVLYNGTRSEKIPKAEFLLQRVMFKREGEQPSAKNSKTNSSDKDGSSNKPVNSNQSVNSSDSSKQPIPNPKK